jgi:probable addiction module antidote protein
VDACIEVADGDVAFIAKALGDIPRAQGTTEVAKNAGLFRVGLYTALPGVRSSGFDTILEVFSTLGLKSSARVRSEAEVSGALLTRRRSAIAA